MKSSKQKGVIVHDKPDKNKEPEQPIIGVAMIARNAAELIPTALDPLVDHVDEVAIVLGGVSKDETPELAEKYATLPVEPFSGKTDKDGRLMSFAEARNQSFDILRRAGVRYAWVVDTDDQWTGAEHARKVVNHMAEGNFSSAMFEYSFEGGSFIQPRIYDMTTGHWDGPCHNYWDYTVGSPVGMQTGLMSVEQVRLPGVASDRRQQNFRISDAWMSEHGDNCRLLLHMAKDAFVEKDYERARNALDRYFIAYEQDDHKDPEELYNAWYSKAGLSMIDEDWQGALFAALTSLTVRPHAQSWTLASEAAGWLSSQSRQDGPLLHLAAFCAQQALDIGKPRGNLHWHGDSLSGALPLFLKARALVGLGEYRRARGSLDLALLIQPDHKESTALRRDISRKLGEME
jgi:tetratricopeptide (TPR) repeat protein